VRVGKEEQDRAHDNLDEHRCLDGMLQGEDLQTLAGSLRKARLPSPSGISGIEFGPGFGCDRDARAEKLGDLRDARSRDSWVLEYGYAQAILASGRITRVACITKSSSLYTVSFSVVFLRRAAQADTLVDDAAAVTCRRIGPARIREKSVLLSRSASVVRAI
jgi:hypothetical protein